MTKVSELIDLEITPGVMPPSDATNYDIPCWSFSEHIRFDPSTGRPRKLGGWTANTFNNSASIQGTMRTIYSATINAKVYTVIGTNSYLYSLIGSTLTNIGPLQTDDVAAPDSLATHYDTLGNDPIATTSGSPVLVITDAEAANYRVGDIYTLEDATTTNGVPDTEINDDHVIRAIGAGTVTIRVGTNASSTGSGGGAIVKRTSGLITLTKAAHGLLDGYRVGIDDAATTGGISDTEINLEFIIRNVTTDTFDFMTGGTATSSVAAGGGGSTIYYPQIDAGDLNQGALQGYGAGLYGAGLYGTALVSDTGQTYPRIWFVDRFGENIVMTPGNQGAVYAWTGDNSSAPAIISGSPDEVNYLFVSDNILVTFGFENENKIFASDQGDYTNWTASATNQVFEDIIEGAGRLISHCPIDDGNLIFTEQQTYAFKYIGLPLVWQITLLDANIGLISPMARVSVNGIAYWMGQDNFYMYRGGGVETIPSNIGPQSSILRYVFDDLNYSQRFKIFAWYNEKFDEIWFHYPSSNSLECNRIARINRKLFAWAPDAMDRTAGEWPVTSLSNPRLGNVGTLYTHETGTDDNGAAMAWEVSTRKFSTGTNTGNSVNVVPDNTFTGTINGTLRMYNYPQSQNVQGSKDFEIETDTELFPLQVNGRYWQIDLSGEELGQSFLMGQWVIDQQQGARTK